MGLCRFMYIWNYQGCMYYYCDGSNNEGSTFREEKRPSSGISMKEKRKELCTFLFYTIFSRDKFRSSRRKPGNKVCSLERDKKQEAYCFV